MKPNLIILTVVVLTIGVGVYIAYNIDDSIGGINDYCATNRLGFVNEYNCTVWNRYYGGERKLLTTATNGYKIIEFCDQHNVTGWRPMSDLGLTGWSALGGFDCEAIRNFNNKEELF